ncbi:hypothetical protein AYO42_05050 [Rhizomicrobium sp. SCGC AG-212-E05]|nr:hypothetical protein AYO42_05050 [Rhizomicrobium sp. SCGC AG-212-E05]
MTVPNPDLLFDRLGPRLPEVPAWAWRTGAFAGLLAAAVAVALHHSWAGGVLLLAGVLAAGAGEALARREGRPALPILPLGLLVIPFGFALAEPGRALAAMFLMFALSVFTVLGRGHVSVVTWLVAASFLVACIFPDHFSLLTYVVGVMVFIAAGQGVARGWA